MDEFKRAVSQSLGYVYRHKCPCCNWSLHGNKRSNIRTLHKMARNKMKRELRRMQNEES